MIELPAVNDSAGYNLPAAYPEGYKPGCLPRKSLPGDWCPMAADRVKIVPRTDWDALAKQIGDGLGLRPFVKVVLDQDGVGSCATEATAGAIMIARAFAGLPHVELNPWFLYYHTSGGRDNGSSIDENLAFAHKYGCAPASVWGRDKGWQQKPSQEAYDAALEFKIAEYWDVSSIDEMVSCILKPHPVVYGANGHAVVKIRHVDTSKGEDLNSWGLWGDNGFGVWATYRAVNWAYGAFAVRAVQES